LAFLFHTVLTLVDRSYQRIRRQRGTRKGFFKDILALTKYRICCLRVGNTYWSSCLMILLILPLKIPHDVLNLELLLSIGLDVGLESFYTDSWGAKIENPRFYRTGEIKIKRAQRLVSRKVKGSSNRRKTML
jgi:hypothetical protein